MIMNIIVLNLTAGGKKSNSMHTGLDLYIDVIINPLY